MKRSYFCLGLSCALLIRATSVLAVEYEYKPLKDFRSEIILPSISHADRALFLKNIQFVYDELYIHKEVKADPTPYIKKLTKKLDTLSDKEFYQQVLKSYDALRDRHTGVVLPKPYSCYRSVLPFNFKEVLDEKGKTVIAVHKFASKEYTDQIPSPLKVEIGDILLTYNGEAAKDLLKAALPFSVGANPEAQRRYELSRFSTKSHAYNFVNEEDVVKLTLQDRMGLSYNIEIPWIVRKNLDCLTQSAYQDYAAPRDEFNKIFSESNDEEWTSTEEPTLKYKILDNESGKFAVIKIESFFTTKLRSYETTELIKNLLKDKFAQVVDGLIFDIRDNSGGYIAIAENIVQLFTPKPITPMIFKLNVSPTNLFYWNTDPYYKTSHFTTALNSASTEGRSFVELPLRLNDETSSLGQVFFKPVAVLNNALCYSACDMFSAMVQDFGAATVFGEDSTTGAGGANIWSYSDFYSGLPKDNKGVFVKLPLELDIDLSYRQSIRSGTHKGELIENVGVKSDFIVKPTLKDLRANGSEQYNEISKHLSNLLN